MIVKIYQLAKSAMQSGKKTTKLWRIKIVNNSQNSNFIDQETKWISSNATSSQLNLTFNNLNDAIDFAKKSNMTYYVKEKPPIKIRKKSYSKNFL